MIMALNLKVSPLSDQTWIQTHLDNGLNSNHIDGIIDSIMNTANFQMALLNYWQVLIARVKFCLNF